LHGVPGVGGAVTLGCASGKGSVGYLGCEDGGGLGGVVLLLQISQEQSKEEQVNYAKD